MKPTGRVKLCLKVAWLTAAVVILGFGVNTGETMFASMMFLSFPASILCALVALLFLQHASLDSLPIYFTVWLILTSGGYLQWFVIVPQLFEKDELILLDLGPEKIKSEAIAEPDQPVVPRPKKRIRRIAAFDRRGRTPLERALGRRS